jgi:transcriptional regulator of acetoin/glycerol metabolism
MLRQQGRRCTHPLRIDYTTLHRKLKRHGIAST